MSDSLANERTLAPTSDNGQSEQASAGQSQGSTSGQPSDNGQAAKEKNNVAEIQRIKDREIANLRRTFEAQDQQRQQEVWQLRQQLNKMQDDAAPDDYTRLQNQIGRLAQERDQYAAAYNQSLQSQRQETEKLQVLNQVVEDFDLVKVEDLRDTDSTLAAVKLATKLQRERERHKEQQDNDKRDRNLPDVGGGAPRTPEGKWEEAYSDAQRRKDTPAMMRLLREKDESRRK